MASADAWEHNVKFATVPNEHYVGDTKAQNDGVTFVFYTSLDAAYQDLSSDSLDVLESVPASVFATFESELPGRTVNQPYAGVQYFTIPQYLPHFSGEEGRLRRQAISLAVDRDTITKDHLQRHPYPRQGLHGPRPSRATTPTSPATMS